MTLAPRTALGLVAGMFLLAVTSLDAQTPEAERERLIARAAKLELPTGYTPPPGDPLAHSAAGLAKVVCSAVFVSGFEPDFAAEHLGYFVSSTAERAKLGRPSLDRDRRRVTVEVPGATARTATYLGDQGCVTLPPGRDQVAFTPIDVESALPDAATSPWPMGDRIPSEPPPAGIDLARVRAAVDAAFEPAAMTAAVVVTWKGRLLAERYGDGVTAQTPLESWSMGKSLIATLLGVLVHQGVYDVEQPAPIPQWQQPGDPRARIRIVDLLQMSSGLRIRAPQDPDFDPAAGYPDHLYLYTGGVDSFAYAATRPQQWPPGQVGRYRNSDPVLVSYLVRLAVEKRGEEYLSFPRRALFDRLGIRTMVLETDPFGNFLTQGYELGSARDWARLANLYLQDGVWNGERILPAGWAKLVSTVAPAWAADGRPIYGGFFWINGDDALAAPRESYSMRGAGGQYTLVIPSHHLVMVRQGHFSGQASALSSLNTALALLLDAVPAR